MILNPQMFRSKVVLFKFPIENQILNRKIVLYLNILLLTDICIVIHFVVVEILLSEEGIV